jgi:hypothetical protein
MSDPVEHDEKSSFLKKNKWLIVAGAVALPIAVYFQANPSTPVEKAPSNAPSSGAKANLGAVGPSAEFNQTFAEKMRLEAVAQQAETKRSMEAAFAAERADSERRLQEALSAQSRQLLTDFKASLAPEQAQAPTPPPKQIRPPTIKTGGGLPALGVQPADTSAGSQPSTPLTSLAHAVVQDPSPVLPPNGFIEAIMLNGVIANPDQPRTFLAKLKGEYTSANGYSASLDGCMMSIEGTADLSAGRIEGKPVRMTCTFENALSKTWDLAGYVVGQDGIRGIPGIIVNNFEKKVFVGSVAGGLAGLGETIKLRQSSVTNSTFGQTTSPSGSTNAAIGGALLQGAGNSAAANLAEVYAHYKPTVQTGGGTRFSAVLLNQLEVPKEGAYLTSTTSRKEIAQ